MPKSSLKTYREKRDFKKTPEPVPKQRIKRKNQQSIFVVQKHHARALHYDFRLEMDGVLKSWAVPKGPSLNPRDRRLAQPTEDHPLEYAKFEGVIPKGQYGGGRVTIWDQGTYEMIKKRPGQLEFYLHGQKLKGGFALVRLRRIRGRKGNPWLLIKMRDEKTKP